MSFYSGDETYGDEVTSGLDDFPATDSRPIIEPSVRICPACGIFAAAPGDRYCSDCGSASDRSSWVDGPNAE